MPFLDSVPRKYLPWKNGAETIIGRAHVLHMLNIVFIHKLLHKDTHLNTLRKLKSFYFPVAKSKVENLCGRGM